MDILFSANSWADYLFWQNDNKKILKKLNELIKDIQRHPYEGLGKPEPIRFELQGFWSRCIDHEQRLVYQVINDELIIG